MMAAGMLACTAAAGCGSQGGALLYFFTPRSAHKVPAKFKLTAGPLLVLFDDSPALDMPPQMPDHIVRAVVNEFQRAKINDNVVSPTRVNELRRTREDFPRRGIREVGRMLNAEQVLWMNPKEFSLADTPEHALEPAKLTVVLKVIDANAMERDKVRLFPVSEDGELVTVTLVPQEVERARTPDELMQKLADALAAEIARLFHEHEPTDAESRAG